MRRFKPILMLAALGVFLTCAQSASAAVALVQKVRNPPPPMATLGVTSTAVSYTAPPTTGNLLIAIVAGDIAIGPLTPPAGWSTAINQLFTFAAGAQIPSQAIFYKVSTGGADQAVTFTYLNDVDANVSIQLFEYSGLVAINPLEGAASAFGSNDVDGATPGLQANSGSILPTSAPALLIAGFAGRPLNASPLVNAGTGNGIFSAYTAGFAEEHNASAPDVPCDAADMGCYGFSSVDRVTAALGSFTVNATFTDQKNGTATQGGWRGQIAAFRPVTVTAADASVSGTITDTNNAPVAGVTIRLSGTQNRLTITDANGNYHFDNVETNGFYSVTPSRANYTFSPTQRSFSQLGQHTDAAFTAVANSTGSIVNPLDTTEFFVRQQYLDFLDREPEEFGLLGWVNTINNCALTNPGHPEQCDAIHVSGAFYQSDEFQQRGYFLYRFYSTAFGRKPDYAEFTPDMKRVSGFLTEAQLESAKQQFAFDFTTRPAFAAKYGSLGNAEYVDALLQTAGVQLSERQTLIDSLNSGSLTRADALRQIVESGAVYQKYYNQAFVVMEYFGYLRRDPDALYLDWIDVLNQTGDPRHMVEGFVNSIEYRNRFKQ